MASLRPAGGDNRRALLSTLKLVARGRMQLTQIVGAVVGQSMSLEPGPQVFDGIQVRSIRRQKCDLDLSGQTVQIANMGQYFDVPLLAVSIDATAMLSFLVLPIVA